MSHPNTLPSAVQDRYSNHSNFNESQSVDEATVDPSSPDVVAHHTQLPAMCRDMLRIIFVLNRHPEQKATGVNIINQIEDEYGAEIGSPYDRLDNLVEADLVEKQHVDGLRKRYTLTQQGQLPLRTLAKLSINHLQPLLSDD